MIIHLIDGTYELFRHYYGLRRLSPKSTPFGAVAGVLGTVIQMLEGGATHIGVATDHIIESFRNELWPGYKTGLGIEPALHAQFVPLEEALVAMGVATWPMVELEADDALASAAYIAAQDPAVEKVCIWTPDKDLAQCVSGTRVVQVDRKSGQIRDDAGVRAKFGVAPSHIADYLALVGDAADGYPGIPRIGAKTAAPDSVEPQCCPRRRRFASHRRNRLPPGRRAPDTRCRTWRGGRPGPPAGRRSAAAPVRGHRPNQSDTQA